MASSMPLTITLISQWIVEGAFTLTSTITGVVLVAVYLVHVFEKVESGYGIVRVQGWH
jgi:hypothetical protein